MYRGKVVSLKTGKIFFLRSYLEAEFLKLLDFDPSVKTYSYEAFAWEYDFNGKLRTYLPDFFVEFYDQRPCVVEVKPRHQLDHPKNLKKFSCGESCCEKLGYRYLVKTDEEIQKPYLLENVKFLRRFNVVVVPLEVQTQTVEILQHGDRLRLDHLMRMIQTESKNLLVFIYSLLYAGKLVAELTHSPIHLKSYIWLPLEFGGKNV